MTQPRPVPVDDPADPRLAEFTALNDPALRRRVERAGDYFVVEGLLAIERLLTLPAWPIRRLLLLPRAFDRLAPVIAASLDRRVGPQPEVLVADEAVLRAVVGFDLHRGALASVTRAPERTASPPALEGAHLLVVAEGINDHENLGSLYRNAAAFGVDAVVLDPTSADPFYRRAVRVSLGHVLAVPTLRATSFPTGLEDLHRCGVTTVALTPSATVDLRDLDRTSLGPGPVAVVVGAEGPGLTPPALATAHHRAAITMADGVDSLNVATATAIALHHLQR